MSGFVEGIDRSQRTLFPAMLDDYVAEDNPVRAVDAFVEGLDLDKLGFGRVEPLEKGRPSYHAATLLKIYIYGYLNRVPSSRRLERECQRNIELVWLTGQLAPDFKTIADFRKDNGKAIREVCRTFVALCRELGLLSVANVATDRHQLSNMAEQARAEMGVQTLDAVADRGYYTGEEIRACEEAGITVTLPKPQTSGAKAAGRFGKQDFVYVAADDVYICPARERLTYHYTNVEDGKILRRYWTNNCQACALKSKCTTGQERRITRWEHEAVLEAVQARLDHHPETMAVRRSTAEHPFGTIKCWMGATHFLTKRLPKVSTEMALNVLAYNMKRVMAIIGVAGLLEAMAA